MSLIFRQRLLRFSTGFMVLNKFVEIYTLIKRNLNFTYEVTSHKVLLQAYCNIKFIYSVIATRKYYLFCLKTKMILNITLITDAKY